MRIVAITRGLHALVDDADFDTVVSQHWQPAFTNGRVRCVQRVVYLGGGRANQQRQTLKLHRELLGITDPSVLVDHRDGNPLNNCRDNLRVATPSQNQANRVTYGQAKRAAGGYLGVCFCRRTGRWVASIKKDQKPRWLGRHRTPELAARAYDAAAIGLFGEFAAVNFPREAQKDH